jgi:hypothetical protein
VFVDDEMVAARVERAPWMRSAAPTGQDATVVLSTKLGEITIEAQTHATTFRSTPAPDSGWSGWPHTLLLQQGCARYRWDGEETFGMIERSSFKTDLDNYPALT